MTEPEKIINYYQIIGVPINASAEDIQAAMQRWMRTVPSDDVTLRVLNGCKEHLLNPQARNKYNRDLMIAYPDFFNTAGMYAAAAQEAAGNRTARQRGATREKREIEASAAQSEGFSGTFKVVMGFIFLICLLGYIMGQCSAPPKSSDNAPVLDKYIVKTECEKLIKENLKAPASAQFGDWAFTEHTIWSYTATGAVDSQNSFGAMLRSRFTCDVNYDSQTKKVKTTAHFEK